MLPLAVEPHALSGIVWVEGNTPHEAKGAHDEADTEARLGKAARRRPSVRTDEESRAVPNLRRGKHQRAAMRLRRNLHSGGSPVAPRLLFARRSDYGAHRAGRGAMMEVIASFLGVWLWGVAVAWLLMRIISR